MSATDGAADICLLLEQTLRGIRIRRKDVRFVDRPDHPTIRREVQRVDGFLLETAAESERRNHQKRRADTPCHSSSCCIGRPSKLDGRQLPTSNFQLTTSAVGSW